MLPPLSLHGVVTLVRGRDTPGMGTPQVAKNLEITESQVGLYIARRRFCVVLPAVEKLFCALAFCGWHHSPARRSVYSACFHRNVWRNAGGRVDQEVQEYPNVALWWVQWGSWLGAPDFDVCLRDRSQEVCLPLPLREDRLSSDPARTFLFCCSGHRRRRHRQRAMRSELLFFRFFWS